MALVLMAASTNDRRDPRVKREAEATGGGGTSSFWRAVSRANRINVAVGRQVRRGMMTTIESGLCRGSCSICGCT